MIERISSGHERLDALLGGGLPANGINLIIGHPGTGKTILAEQYLFHNATRERPGVYLSTMSEPFDKILRYGQVADVLRHRRDRHVGLLRRSRRGRQPATAFPGVVDQIDVLLKEQQPSFVVIDSFKALRVVRLRRSRVPPVPARPRRPPHARSPRPSFWIGEYDRNQAADAPGVRGRRCDHRARTSTGPPNASCGCCRC